MRAVGPIMQSSFVVPDWREAALHWAETLGVGPFFVFEHIAFAQLRYRGEPTAIDMSVAIAYSGELQIELVEQHDDTRSIYTDFLGDHAPGLQHVGALTADLECALDDNALRAKIVQDGITATGLRFAYVDTVLHNGSMLEIIEADASTRDAFEYMKETARHWDGSDPLRG